MARASTREGLIRAPVAERPDATIDELQAQLAEEGVITSRSPLGRCLLALGLTRKKDPARRRAGAPLRRRGQEAWRAAQPQLTRYQLVFLDETWAKTNMARLYGRSPRGERLVCVEPHGHWKTKTLIAAIRPAGVVAPYIQDGAINGDVFLAYAEQVLALTLEPGDIAIMDNLASHKVAGVRAAIEATGATLLYLPA